jgi:hypothetical protein
MGRRCLLHGGWCVSSSSSSSWRCWWCLAIIAITLVASCVDGYAVLLPAAAVRNRFVLPHYAAIPGSDTRRSKVGGTGNGHTIAMAAYKEGNNDGQQPKKNIKNDRSYTRRSTAKAKSKEKKSTTTNRKTVKLPPRPQQQQPTSSNAAKSSRWRVFGINVHPDALVDDDDNVVEEEEQEADHDAASIEEKNPRNRIMTTETNNNKKKKKDDTATTATTTLHPAVWSALTKRLGETIRIQNATIVRRSVDARQRRNERQKDKHPVYVYTIDVTVADGNEKRPLRPEPGRLERLLDDDDDTTTSVVATTTTTTTTRGRTNCTTIATRQRGGRRSHHVVARTTNRRDTDDENDENGRDCGGRARGPILCPRAIVKQR